MNTRKLFGLIVFTVLITLALVSVTNAQGPAPHAPSTIGGTAFTYQGQLKNNGTAVNGTCDLTFSLWDGSGLLANQIGTTQTKTSVTVTNGLFTIPDLDFGSGAFNGDARYLAISVRCPAGSGLYTALTPKQALTPAPMALALPGFYTQPNTTSPNVIGGYDGNTVDSGLSGATISGGGSSGYINHVTTNYGTIGGGQSNIVSGDYGTVGGGGNNTASGGATVGGGGFNSASGGSATIGGGGNNTASVALATVGGGAYNIASGFGAFVGGGGDDGTSFGGNKAQAPASTVSGGISNTVTSSGYYGTIGGGLSNTVNNNYNATVSGGARNTASGAGATVPGGDNNTASGDFSFAAGFRAKANADGNFTFADSNDFDFVSTTANSFRVRSTGGVRFVLGIDGTGATTWSCSVVNGGSWSCSSDRNLKENFVAVDGRTTLARLSQVPILQWNAKGTDPHVKHFGPMAQDFYAAFGLGEDDKSISTIDLDGVALSAIQGLNQIVQDQDAKLTAQQKQIDDLNARLTALENGTVAAQSPLAGLGNNAWLVGATLVAVVWVGRNRRGGAR